MNKYEEIEMIYSMLAKFQIDKETALEDKIKLLTFLEKDPTLKDTPIYKNAWKSVEQRLDDVKISVELLRKQLFKLTEKREDGTEFDDEE